MKLQPRNVMFHSWLSVPNATVSKESFKKNQNPDHIWIQEPWMLIAAELPKSNRLFFETGPTLQKFNPKSTKNPWILIISFFHSHSFNQSIFPELLEVRPVAKSKFWELMFLQAGCYYCHQTNSIKAMREKQVNSFLKIMQL